MATESPLFQSSMELLAHSISHFNSGDELDRKLLILHLANSIELLLKDLVLDTGVSIYSGPKETINIHKCLSILKGQEVDVPVVNKIELLIDERNALQHRFGSPNELTSIFYMDIAMSFFKEVLAQQYDLDLDETLDDFADNQDLLVFRLREPANESELDNLKKLAAVHPLGALLSAMAYMENAGQAFWEQVGLDSGVPMRSMSLLATAQLKRVGITIPEDLRDELNELRMLRNLAAHGRKDPSVGEVIHGLDVIEKYEAYLASLNLDEVRPLVEEWNRKRQLKLEEHRRKLEEERMLKELLE